MTSAVNHRAELARFADLASGPKDRFGDLYLAVANLFTHQNESLAERERELAANIVRRISKDVEMSLRIGLAERLADSSDAPHELILLLADERIEVACPVLMRSPMLSDADLACIAERHPNEHSVMIAQRPNIGATVSAALAKSACEDVVIALLRNRTANIDTKTFDAIVDRARQIVSLQEPLSERSDLPIALACRMYVWVSSALKSQLIRRYPQVAQSLAPAIDETAASLHAGKVVTSEASAKKLVEKLVTSGQLRASFLIRVLHQGQIELFDHGFAALLQMEVDVMRKALYSDSPHAVALACRAAGIDRSAFLTVFNLSRDQKRVPTVISDSEQREIQTIFSQVQKIDALQRLKAVAA